MCSQSCDCVWNPAKRSAAIWRNVAGPAGIGIEQHGQLLVAQQEEADAVFDQFLSTNMGAECTLLTQADVAGQWSMIQHLRAALSSQRDLREDSPS